nr:hypothetical protein CFP56_22756 [Quercus suber]
MSKIFSMGLRPWIGHERRGSSECLLVDRSGYRTWLCLLVDRSGFRRWGVSAWTEVGLACSWVGVVLNLINVRLGRLVENGGEKPTQAVAENSKELCEPLPADPSKFAPIVGEDAMSTQKDEVAPATAVDASIADEKKKL